MRWLIIVSFLFPASAAAAESAYSACLPPGIQPTDVVSHRSTKPGVRQGGAITVGETLARLEARCKMGRLADGSGKQIYFFRLSGCWGNPPANYQEILDRQNSELSKLKQRYTVIEMTCNPSGEPVY